MSFTSCPCSEPRLCSYCVRRGLCAAQEQRKKAMEAVQQAKAAFEATDASQWFELEERLADARDLRERLQLLQQQSTEKALKIARRAVEIEHQLVVEQAPTREKLHRLDETLLGGLQQAIQQARGTVRRLRFQWAIEAYELHRVVVQNPGCKTKTVKQARGIGKIGGLPLPHAGPELFGVLPPLELQSALRLVASVTSIMARCLGIILPHPILLQGTGGTQDDIAIPLEPKPVLQQANHNNSSNTLATSTSSLASIIMGQSKAVLSRAMMQTPTRLETTVSTLQVPPSMDPVNVQQRIRHAQAAILAEDVTSKSHYALCTTETTHQDEFAIALSLLQNNVVALCIRAGVPVDRLWPAQAVLLNLYSLYQYCQEQVLET